MICPKCNSEIRDDSKFCSKCGANCTAMSSKNESQKQFSNSKKYCRICNTEISSGTLCKKCSKSTNEELLTIEERKKRNESISTRNALLFILGLLLTFIGFILFVMFCTWHEVIMMLMGILLIVFSALTSSSVCSACQRRNTMQKINTELVGTRNTYIKETRKVYHTRKNGKTYINETPDYDEYEVDVPATEYLYDVTYKCNKCGHIEVQRETKIQKD